MSTELEDEAPAEEIEEEDEVCTCGFTGPNALSANSDEDGHCCTCASTDDDCECVACGCGDKFSSEEYSQCENCGDIIQCCCNCYTCCHCDGRYGEDYVCHNCDVCEGCGCSCGEDENSERGSSTTPPWVVRGVELMWPTVRAYPQEVRGVCSEYEVAKYMGLDSKSIDPTQAMAGYYLTEFVASAVMCSNGMQFEPDVESYVLEGQRIKDEIVTLLDRPFQIYVDMACGGELRHHNVFRAGHMLNSARYLAWYDWMQIRKELGAQALLDMAALFDEFHSGTGYGGKLWGDGARVLHLRETGAISPAIFVDRVFNLQHNGGCFLNKLPWDVQNQPRWGLDAMVQYIGPAHSANPPLWAVLMAAATPEVRKVFTSYWKAVNKAKAGWRLPRTPVPGILDGSERGYGARSVMWTLKYKQPKSNAMHTATAHWEDCPFVPEPRKIVLPSVEPKASWGSPKKAIHKAAEEWNEGNARTAWEMMVWAAKASGDYDIEVWESLPPLTNLGEEVMSLDHTPTASFGRRMYAMLIDAQHQIDRTGSAGDRYQYVHNIDRVIYAQQNHKTTLEREARKAELAKVKAGGEATSLNVSYYSTTTNMVHAHNAGNHPTIDQEEKF